MPPAEVRTPDISGISVSQVGFNRATVNAEVTNAAQIAKCDFAVFCQSDTIWNEGKLSGNKFSAVIRGLHSGSDYSCFAIISNGNANFRKSQCISFRTEIEPDVIEIKDQQLLAALLSKFDLDKSGNLSREEASKITRFSCNTDKIRTLEGLEYCPNLQILSVQGTRKDNSALGLLETVPDLNENLNELFGQHNRICRLDLSGYKQLRQIDMCLNQIAEIDLSGHNNLILIGLGFNMLKKLDVRGLNCVREISCDNNPLDTLLLDNKSLESLNCSSTSLTSLDISKCPVIQHLDCSGCTGLKVLYLAEGQALSESRIPETVVIEYK